MFLKKITFATPWILLVCFSIYSVLSWVLLFRDKRALDGIGLFYPQINTLLFSTREYLLQNNLNTLPTFLFGILSIVAIFFYLKSLTAKISLKRTIIFAILFQAVTFVSYPILSTDIYSYMFSERVATIHNENVWKVAPATFPEDPFYEIADWKETTSVYGGMHFIAYYVPSLVGQNNLILLTILYKLIPALFAFGIGYVLYLLLKEYKSSYVETGLRLVFWNPLFILEIFSSGHNDSIMIFFVLLSILLFKKQFWMIAGVMLAFAVQVKILPVVLLFFYGLALIKQKKLVQFSSLVVSFIVTNILFFAIMQVHIFDFVQRVLFNNGVLWQSLSNVLARYMEGTSIFILFFFIFWIVYFVIFQWKRLDNPSYGYVSVFLVYLLFVSSAYWNWYVLWILPLLPFVEDRKIFWTALVFSFTSLLAYPLLWLSLRFGFGSMVWPVITYILLFGTPIFVYLCFLFKEKDTNVILKRFALDKVFADKAHH